MAIVLICGSCGKKMSVPDEYAGRKGQCSACGTKLLVPVPKGMTVPNPAAAAPTPTPTPAASASAPASRPKMSAPPPLKSPPPPPSYVDPDDDGVNYGLAEDELFDTPKKKRSLDDDDDVFDEGDDDSEALPRSSRSRDQFESRGGPRTPKTKKKKKKGSNGAIAAAKVLAIVGVVIGCVIMLGVGLYAIGSGLIDPTPSSWTSYDSPDGSFAIAMPGKPKNETQNSPFGGGSGVKMQSVKGQYGIMAETLPLGTLTPVGEAQSAGLLKLFAPALVTGLSGRELSRKDDLWVYGLPALQMKLETSSLMQNAAGSFVMAEADVLVFIDDGKLYALWVIHMGKSGSPRLAKKIHERPELVFETFKQRTQPNKLKVEAGRNHSLNADIGWAQARGFMNLGAPSAPPLPPNFGQPPSIPNIPVPPNFPGPRNQGRQPGDPTVLPGPGGGLILPM